MKSVLCFLGCVALLATSSPVTGAAPATNAPPAKTPKAVAASAAAAAVSKTNAPVANAPTIPAPAPVAPAPAQPPLKFDDYINDLATNLKLTDEEKRAVQFYYLSDGNELKNILNNDSLSPLQKEREVSDLRAARNAKIDGLLPNIDRQHAFMAIEARYRVALTELAADGGLIPAPASALAK